MIVSFQRTQCKVTFIFDIVPRVCSSDVPALIHSVLLKHVTMYTCLIVIMKTHRTFMGIPCVAGSHMMRMVGLFWRYVLHYFPANTVTFLEVTIILVYPSLYIVYFTSPLLLSLYLIASFVKFNLIIRFTHAYLLTALLFSSLYVI